MEIDILGGNFKEEQLVVCGLNIRFAPGFEYPRESHITQVDTSHIAPFEKASARSELSLAASNDYSIMVWGYHST